jgi:3-phosphoshikimate 1-carboxyvinyltransferase
VRPPGSRSLTNRALAAAALAEGPSELVGATENDDTVAMRRGLVALGVPIAVEADTWRVAGTGGHLRASGEIGLDVRASGTTARFLTALAGLTPEGTQVTLDGTARMRERPIGELTDALTALGVDATPLGAGGCPPVRVRGGGVRGGRIQIDARRSSQFVSAVLLAAPCATESVTLALTEGRLVSRPFVDMTLQVMQAFGAEAGWTEAGELTVRAGAPYEGRRFTIEPDAQAAVYAFAAAAIAGGRVVVEGIPPDSQQADLDILGALAAMGCQVHRDADRIEVRATRGSLEGIRWNGNAAPDAMLALAVVALFARGPTEIHDIAHMRIKETDRLEALQNEIRRLGGRAEATSDALRIEPAPLSGAAIETYEDHRMAMSFALAGLVVPGVSIRDPGCVAKTWPDYFSALSSW